MALGKRKPVVQQPLFVTTADLRVRPNPFYDAVNRVLAAHHFDAFAEQACAAFYDDGARGGRPGLAPGIYFRCLMVGYFEGIDSERGIDWRCNDSLSLKLFLGVAIDEPAPDHSTISRTRRLIDVETHAAVFQETLKVLANHGLIDGKTAGVDSTTLEANAAMRGIVRRDTGEGYQAFLTRLAQESGIPTPTREDLARLDRTRKNKASNDDWQNPHDPDARITKMKDGSTHLAHKAEHAVDLGDGAHGAILAVNVCDAAAGDTATLTGHAGGRDREPGGDQGRRARRRQTPRRLRQRGGAGQGVPQQADAARPRRDEDPQLRQRAGARATGLGGPGRRAGRGLRESQADPGRTR
jgi:transposase